jgi:hypothetical protein
MPFYSDKTRLLLKKSRDNKLELTCLSHSKLPLLLLHKKSLLPNNENK